MNEWYKLTPAETLDALKANGTDGLSSSEAAARLDSYGPNEFTKQKKEGLLRQALHHLRDISTIILILAGALSLALAIREGHGYIEPIVIFAIVAMNVVLGVTQERSAEKALDALQSLNSPDALVLRDGARQKLETRLLVPGDVILLKTGDYVPADARLLESVDLSVDESALTGESEPSEKNSDCLPEDDVPIGDQCNMVFSGCLVTAGNATAVVAETGMRTQMGKIAGYLNNDQKLRTPLQLRLAKIGKIISAVAIASGVVLFAVGTLQGEDFWSMVLLAVSLAVAAVPETLSLIVTLSLTRGVKNMVGKNALIRKLPAVETLGNTSVICSDKTGTLTQNRMTVRRLWTGGKPFKASAGFDAEQLAFLKMLALASNARAETDANGKRRIFGDPTESAIIRLLGEKGLRKEDLEAEHPRVAEIPFSSSRKMMTTVHRESEGGYLVLAKGAFDRLPCKRGAAEATLRRKQVHDDFAGDALRVIALASKHVDALPEDLSELERDLEFEGIIGLIDPPRPEAAAAIETARKAGIRTVMITGDHAATAGAIAREIGILGETEKVVTGKQLHAMDDAELCENVREYSVYARVSPEDKIRIVEAWQEQGEVVSMTGDGVNDAPALKAADVGVAMGISGTEVAKTASDMVLTDDNFATIVDAVREGRGVFANIRKTIYFLLVCNLSEIAIMLGAQIMGWGVPVTPVMLLLINVIGDGVPGLHLAREKPDERVMDRKPIARDESFFAGGLTAAIAQQAIAFTIVTWVGYWCATFLTMSPYIPASQAVGQTVAFLILGWTSILHIFTVRSPGSVFRRTLRDNVPLAVSAVAMLALFAALVAVPPLAALFGFTAIAPAHWLMAILLSLVPTAVAEVSKWVGSLLKARRYRKRLLRYQA